MHTYQPVSFFWPLKSSMRQIWQLWGPPAFLLLELLPPARPWLPWHEGATSTQPCSHATCLGASTFIEYNNQQCPGVVDQANKRGACGEVAHRSRAIWVGKYCWRSPSPMPPDWEPVLQDFFQSLCHWSSRRPRHFTRGRNIFLIAAEFTYLFQISHLPA